MSKTTEQVKQGLKKRYKKEHRFRRLGFSAIVAAFLFLVFLFASIITQSLPAFTLNSVNMEVNFDPKILKLEPGETDANKLQKGKYAKLVSTTLYQNFPDISERADKRKLRKLLSGEAKYHLRDMVVANPALIGTTKTVAFLVGDDVDTFIKEGGLTSDKLISNRLNDRQIGWIRQWHQNGQLDSRFNWTFFTNPDSRAPELAGIKGALTGTFLTILVTIALAFPIGVFAAIYLEEFAPKNKITDWIEININNLAAVPSIVFGLLGLAVFINLAGMPRSVPLVGGLVLALMTLPTIIISSRSAIKAVPPSIKDAALGLGASKMQTVFHQILPQAMPGILTGGIIGVAQAIGETAPLLMIGMVAFIVDVPQTLTDSATVLPVQIYIWADSPERAFTAKTSAAILVLLTVLMLINATAVYLRKKLEKE
ncbi:MAG: phosphate ABC transporter, permease protein PstA [Gammaproteobacteria bacterium]|nr:MAG: phosphate ABC transporter, permease protein PstA [Gammaproteobacteria bacterium]